MPSDPPAIRSDTAESCWLCDHERGELCHVHAPHSDGAAEREPPEVAWALPATEEP